MSKFLELRSQEEIQMTNEVNMKCLKVPESKSSENPKILGGKKKICGLWMHIAGHILDIHGFSALFGLLRLF